MGGSGDGWIHGSSLGSHLGMPEHPDWNRGFVKGVCVCHRYVERVPFS